MAASRLLVLALLVGMPVFATTIYQKGTTLSNQLAVPEPATYMLIGLGLAALGLIRARRR